MNKDKGTLSERGGPCRRSYIFYTSSFDFSTWWMDGWMLPPPEPFPYILVPCCLEPRRGGEKNIERQTPSEQEVWSWYSAR